MRSHHVVFLAPEGVPGDIEIPKIDRDAFANGLREAGVDEEQAEMLARAAHRSLVAFQEEAPSRGARRRAWSSAFRSKVLRRAWLAGGWQEARSGDTDALSLLFGVPYEDARAELQAFASGADPIFAVVGGTWALTSPEQAWQFASAQLTAHDLAALVTVIQTVLGAVNPALELPVEERWMAAIHGKTRIHSTDLRRGLSTTLAACGAFGEETSVGGVGTAADWASGVVAQLLRRANEDPRGDVWASLSDLLPLLAEAAPDAFLRAVQEGVTERSRPVLATMFLDQEGDAFSVSSPHTGLLWALETTAWSEEHAPLAIKLLARLAEIDPGGRLSNRPAGTLVDIFRTWLPQTSLPASRRLAVLDALRRDHEEVAWTLMLTLLPEHEAVGSYTHAPRFRTWKPETEGVTYAEIWEVSSAVAQRLLDDAARRPQRWLELVNRLADFPPPDLPPALDRLRELGRTTQLGTELRQALWSELDRLVRTHRKFSDAEWALPAEQVDRLAEVATLFSPTDPVAANSWLFDDHFPDLGSDRLDYHEEETRLRIARAAAVAEVLSAEGVAGVLRLAESVKLPGFVGLAAASHASPDLDQHLVTLIDEDDPKLASLAYGYSDGRFREGGVAWLEQQIKEFLDRPLAQARLLQSDDDLPQAWAIAAEHGTEVEELYWREFSPMGRGADFQHVNEAAMSLLRFGRIITALDTMNLYVRKEDRRVSTELVVEALERFVHLPPGHDEMRQVSSYELNGLLNYVRDADVDEERLGTLEWQLLPALGYDAQSPTLERRLARDPEFFVEILSLVYKPRNAETTGEVDPLMARNAYRLLDQWKIVPGSATIGGEIDPDVLNDWTSQARELLTEADRREVGDVHIGKVLAFARSDEDGTWPAKPVRDLIERIGSSEIEEGLQVQIYNNRGSSTRGAYDGGDQERGLAAKYRDAADLIRDGWSRTAAVLSALATSYERDARRIDEEAERRREGMDR